MSAQALTPIQTAIVPLADLERMATAIAKSGLFGVKEPAQAIALCLIAQAEGMHPAIAARDYNVIQGRPSLKAEAMLSRFIAAGGKVTWHALSTTIADATFSHPQGGEVRIDWTLEMASKITTDEWTGPPGQRTKRSKPLTDKDNWRNYPRAMLRSRCISEGVRTVCPSATGGMYTPEEVRDFPLEKEVHGDVVSLTRQPVDLPPAEAEPPIGAGSHAHKAIEARIAELGLNRDGIKEWMRRRFAVEHFPDLTATQQHQVMEALPMLAVAKLRKAIATMTDPSELGSILKSPPAWLQGDDLAAVVLEIDERLSALAAPADSKEDGPHE